MINAPAQVVACALLLSVCAIACTPVPPVTYRLRDVVTSPLRAVGAQDPVAFAKVFCGTLTHLDPQHTEWGPCGRYLDAQVGEHPAVTTPISSNWRVLVVGGLFSHCFEKENVHAFEQALAHLTSAHQLQTHRLSVGSVETPEHNAAIIAEYLTRNPGRYIAIGHSKGAVDLMTAIQTHKVAQDNIHALASVAGAISGSRLVDFGIPAAVIGFSAAVKSSGLGSCRIEERGGIASLKRDVRNAFLRLWNPPSSLRSYSIVGVVDKDHVSRPLLGMWKIQSAYSADQDSQVIAEEAVIPGARYMGVATGDHWALALPLSEHPSEQVRKKVGPNNRYPRVAMLEAIVRFVDETSAALPQPGPQPVRK